MTIALGYRCIDGFVLATDSYESDGITKKMVDKIWSYEVQDSWGIAIASAGEADLADSFNESLREVLGNSDFDHAKLMAKLKLAIASTRRTYPESQLSMLIGVYGQPAAGFHVASLYRVYDASMHLGPVTGHQSLGIGASVSKFLCEHAYGMTVHVAEAARMAVFTIARVKEHVDGCDGPTSMITYTRDKINASFKIWGRPEIDSIEAELNAKDFRAAFNEYWKAHNPPFVFPGGKNEPSYGGSVRWTRTAKLGTK